MDLLFKLKAKGSLTGDQRSVGKSRSYQCGVADRGARPAQQGRPVEGRGDWLGIYIDRHTHIEAVRYPNGAGAMRTLLTGGRPGWNRIMLWLATLFGGLLRHPLRTVRCLHPFGWARETLILLCAQTVDGFIDMRLARPWFWPF